MKKSIVYAAVAVLALAGCAKVTVFDKADKDAVAFGAYSGRTIVKAGSTEDITLDNLKSIGFGVFATYSGVDDFSAATDDFMYNQQVSFTDPDWTYSPIKYWPNPTNGQSADAQKVSFFAYAPYCDPEDAAADNSYGITGFKVEGGHDIVEYKFASNKPNVDLLWGYKTKSTTQPYTYTVNENLTRTTDKVSFIFQHMLSKLAGSQDGDPATVGANGLIIKTSPTVDPTNGFGVDNGTKITVSEIVVKSADTDLNGDPIVYAADDETIDGQLDLYTGEFTVTGTVKNIKFEQTVSADAAAVAAGASELADDLKEVASPANFAAVNPGVKKEAVNVYKDENDPLILIPGTTPVVDVTITYVVRTYDEKLGTKQYSEVPQTVYGKVAFPTIEKNKKYNLLIIVGLNDAKFEATVEDWTIGRTDVNGDGVVDEKDDVNVWLPENL